MAFPWIPVPPSDGGRVRSYYLLREVARHHTVDLFCVRNAGEDPAPLRQVQAWHERLAVVDSPVRYDGASKLRALFGALPFGAMPPRSEVATQLAARIAEWQPQLVHLQGMEFAGCVPLVERTSRLVFDMVDCNSVQMRRRAAQVASPLRRWWYLAQAGKYAQAERALLQRPVSVALTSPADADALLAHPHHAGVRTTVIPDGVDAAAVGAPAAAEGPARLVFTGNMAYLPNDDAVRYFCREILPRIRRALPQIGFDVIGKQPSAALRQACARAGGVEVLGFVPDLRREVVSRTLFVCPLRIGTGIKVKLLEAMAWGMPIVATPLSVEGMAVQHDRHVLIADSAEAFAARVVDALASPALRARLGREAQQFVRESYTWEAVGDRLAAVYREAAS